MDQPSHSLEVSLSAAPSQRSWLMSLGVVRNPGTAGPPRAASWGSWDEGALLGSGLALPASQGAWLPENEVRLWVRLQDPDWEASV